MLIGTEQYSSGPDTPRDELPEWARVATRLNSFDNIARTVVHEAALGPRHAETERERYGRAHERAVWLDFKAVDIGYWVGYRIAQTYYERAPDKQAAVRELILLPDPERLLAESGYAAYAESLPDR